MDIKDFKIGEEWFSLDEGDPYIITDIDYDKWVKIKWWWDEHEEIYSIQDVGQWLHEIKMEDGGVKCGYCGKVINKDDLQYNRWMRIKGGIMHWKCSDK